MNCPWVMGRGVHGSRDLFFYIFRLLWWSFLEGKGQKLDYSKGIKIRHFAKNSSVLISVINTQVKSPLPFILKHQRSCLFISSYRVFTVCTSSYIQGIQNTELLEVIVTRKGHKVKRIQMIHHLLVSPSAHS